MPAPIARGNPSLHEKPGLWHDAQEIQLDPERRGSKNKVRPSSSRAGVTRLSAGSGTCVGRAYFLPNCSYAANVASDAARLWRQRLVTSVAAVSPAIVRAVRGVV